MDDVCSSTSSFMADYYPPLNNCKSGVYEIVKILFSQGICRVAVPLFYLISGYLFYIGLRDWNYGQYAKKLKKRIFSLLIPYLLWNIIACAIYIFSRCILRNEFTLCDINIFEILWADSSGWPKDVPMWFVRDLMVVCILSPIVYWWVKNLRLLGILIIAILHISNLWIPVSGFSSTSTLFFAIGCYFQISGNDITSFAHKYRIVSYSVSVLLLISIVLCWGNIPVNGHLHSAFMIFGSFATISIICNIKVNTNHVVYKRITEASFFIYAIHNIGIVGVKRIVNKCIGFNIAGYFLISIITFIVSYMIYIFMKRFTPKTLKILNGNR